MSSFLDEFKLQVFDSIIIEVVGYFCRAIDDIQKFVDLQKLIVLNSGCSYLHGCEIADVKPVLYFGALELAFHVKTLLLN